MNYSVKKIKQNLIQCIKDICNLSSTFVKNPGKDFSRNRKLPFDFMIKSILSMSGGSLSNELIDLFGINPDIPSNSAYIQQRDKILPKAFETLFHMFTSSVSDSKLYKGYRLLAVDGSDLHIPTNPKDNDSFYPGTDGRKSYNLLHLNAMYDLCANIYTDVTIQKSHNMSEHKAFVNLVDRFDAEYPSIIIADRGYESYNNLAHVQEKGLNFLVRIRDSSTNCMFSSFDLPDEDEFDVPFKLSLTRKQTNETKELFKNKNSYKFIPHTVKFDYLPQRIKKSLEIKPYVLCFRIVRLKISDDLYEVVITNLDADTFPPEELKKLYAMRWGIETSFRSLKHTVGLLYFHSKKTECIYQEIFAGLTMYNFAQMIISTIIIKQKNRKHCYKINFSVTVHICRQYILKCISPPNVEALISKYVVPIRPDRERQCEASVRRASISFLYRVS